MDDERLKNDGTVLDGITTAFVRCLDPTNAGVVAKITRERLVNPKEVGWT